MASAMRCGRSLCVLAGATMLLLNLQMMTNTTTISTRPSEFCTVLHTLSFVANSSDIFTCNSICVVGFFLLVSVGMFLGKQAVEHTHPFNGSLSGTTQVSQYQKDETNPDFTEARDSEWQWHQLSHMQVCTSLQTDSHASTASLGLLQAGCPSCRPTNSVKVLKA